MAEKRDFAAHTIKGTGRLRELKSEIRFCAAFDPVATPKDQHPQLHAFVALWDTGATGSVITQRVVDACGLKPIMMMKVQGAYGGITDRPAFLVNVMLPQGVGVTNVTVVLGELAGMDALIGMDIITLGDFAITNEGDKTTFSFRYPSLHTIDYVKQAEAIRTSKEVRLGSHRGPNVHPSSRKKGR